MFIKVKYYTEKQNKFQPTMIGYLVKDNAILNTDLIASIEYFIEPDTQYKQHDFSAVKGGRLLSVQMVNSAVYLIDMEDAVQIFEIIGVRL